MSFKVLYGSSVAYNQIVTNNNSNFLKFDGEKDGKRSSFTMSEDQLSKHLLMLGSTGSGKSTLFFQIIKQIKAQMTNDDVMIIFDSKGDYIQRFFENGDLYIDNITDTSSKWNIFRDILADGSDDEHIKQNCNEICKSLFKERVKNTTNAFFPNAASDVLSSILLSLTRAGIQDKNIRIKMFYNNELRSLLDSCDENKVKAMLASHKDLIAVNSYISYPGPQSQGVLSEMFSVVRDIFVGNFAKKGNFSIRNFVRNKGGKTLFIEYDLAKGNSLTPIYRLCFDQALKEAMSRNQKTGNVYLICDEFKLIPLLEHIEDGVNFGRSLGLKILAGIQSTEQLVDIYGKSRAMSIMAGFSTLISFRTNDMASREYVSNLYGKNLVIEDYQKSDFTMVEEKRLGHTVEDWHQNSLPVGQAIVGLPFSQPFIFKFDDFR